MSLSAHEFAVCLDLGGDTPGGDMQLTPHDLHILRLASGNPEGRIGFGISREGSIQFFPMGDPAPVPAEDALPKLEDLGFLKREVNRSYVLTPEGWDLVLGGGGVLLPDPNGRSR